VHLYYNKRKESLKWIGGFTVEVVFRVCVVSNHQN
jgi:hypothetical protein